MKRETLGEKMIGRSTMFPPNSMLMSHDGGQFLPDLKQKEAKQKNLNWSFLEPEKRSPRSKRLMRKTMKSHNNGKFLHQNTSDLSNTSPEIPEEVKVAPPKKIKPNFYVHKGNYGAKEQVVQRVRQSQTFK